MMNCRILPLAILLLLLVPAVVWAHGGDLVYQGDAGPYAVEVYLLRLRGGENQSDSLDYTLSLREAESGRPADGATVTVAAETSGGTIGPMEATGFTNQYQVILPVEHPGTWTMEVQIEGSAGAATLTHQLDVEAPQAWWEDILANPLVLAAIAVGTLTIGMFVYQLRQDLAGHTS